MENNINIKLRAEILEIALNLENNVNQLLLAILSIDSPKRKAITNKSGSLSFRNKIDLLFDLDILNSDEHKKILLLIEFRNQFLHSIECNSFDVSVQQLGIDKGNKLLKHCLLDENLITELRYHNAFNNLYRESLGIFLKKINDRAIEVESLRKAHVTFVEQGVFFLINTITFYKMYY